MEKCTTHHNCNHLSTSANQTLEEMDFERGPWSAALEGDLHQLKKRLKKVNTDITDTSGYSSLHYASRAGHLEIVEYLVTNGANVNLLTRSNQSSPLHRASKQGHTAVVSYLLKNGADAELKDSDGFTPLHHAAWANHLEICKLLISYNQHLAQISDPLGRMPKDCCSHPTVLEVLVLNS